MPPYRPRSIVSLVLVAFGFALSPFLVAVVAAVIQVDRFAGENRSAVLNAAAAADESRLLVEELREMQRSLGQFAVLGDRAFFDRYLEYRADFRDALMNLRAQNLYGLDAENFESFATDAAALFTRLESAGDNSAVVDWDAINDILAMLVTRARELLDESDQLIQLRANEVTERAESLQQTLLVIAAAAVPVTILLVILFTVLITRPLRAIGREIRRLGSRSLEGPVSVSGPEDIEALAGELEWLRRRLRSLEDQKATFLQHISHELKTPLTTIREGSELLVESLGEGRPEDGEIAELLRENGLMLQKLIEDLLQFAKTQELALDLEFETAVDLAALIEEAAAALGMIADAKELHIERDLAVLRVRCDAGKIRTVVDNLLGNAIKYSPPNGTIQIALSKDEDRAVIDVRDSGPGVGTEERERIFEPFGQGSAEYQSSVKGTGLGLSIAREYVEAHGGGIELVAGTRGAHFRVSLPMAGPGAPHVAA